MHAKICFEGFYTMFLKKFPILIISLIFLSSNCGFADTLCEELQNELPRAQRLNDANAVLQKYAHQLRAQRTRLVDLKARASEFFDLDPDFPFEESILRECTASKRTILSDLYRMGIREENLSFSRASEKQPSQNFPAIPFFLRTDGAERLWQQCSHKRESLDEVAIKVFPAFFIRLGANFELAVNEMYRVQLEALADYLNSILEADVAAQPIGEY